MRIVALDTTSNAGSIALYEENLVEEFAMHSTEGFSRSLYDDLSRLLLRHKWPLRSVNRFAAAAGPGSFTGVRIGLTAIKGLAEAIGAEAVAVSNLKALAYFGSTERRAVLIDARRGEFYAAVYDATFQELEPEIVMSLEAWITSIMPPTELICADSTAIPWDIPQTQPRLLAGAIAAIAAVTKPQSVEAIDANYVRRSDAELFWKDLPG